MSERDESLKQLSQLLSQLCDGTLGASDYRRIEELALSSAEARQLYIDYLLLDGELRWAGGAANTPAPTRLQPEMVAAGRPDGDGATARTAADEQTERVGGQGLGVRGRRRLRIAAVLAATVLIGAVGLFGPGRSGRDVEEQPVAATEPTEPGIALDGVKFAIAELRSSDNCRWGGAESGLANGSQIYSGRKLELIEGVARFAFAKGAMVLVESPAKFELVSATSLRLVHGNVAVRATGPVKEFVVLSRDASIVDLGTSFAVHCDENGATEVDVLEGSVEVVPENNPRKRRVLEMGASAQIDTAGKSVSPFARLPDDDRFANLIEHLWSDIRVAQEGAVLPGGSSEHTVSANFNDALPGAVDTFYGAKRGDGWLTPWVASGNPKGSILRDDVDFGVNDPFLRVSFSRSYERAIAREYGPRLGFDPNLPHVISWRWRSEDTSMRFEQDFFNRVTFYGNPFFRRNSWPTNSWLIGVVGGDEDQKRRPSQSSTEYLKRQHGSTKKDDGDLGVPRRVHAKRWYFFDSKSEGVSGAVYDRRNMIDTGMSIKPGVLYHFAVAVYPQEARYDAAIRDDEQTVVRTGLVFRSRQTVPANVIHFTMHTPKSNDKRSFSLDSVRIESLANTSLRQQLEGQSHDDGKKSAGAGE